MEKRFLTTVLSTGLTLYLHFTLKEPLIESLIVGCLALISFHLYDISAKMDK